MLRNYTVEDKEKIWNMAFSDDPEVILMGIELAKGFIPNRYHSSDLRKIQLYGMGRIAYMDMIKIHNACIDNYLMKTSWRNYSKTGKLQVTDDTGPR
jgi:hypothetical protein